MSVLSKPIPADHLLVIFGRVSTKTLLRLPLLCTAWSSLQPTACRQTHTLSLSITNESASAQRHPYTLRLYLPTIGQYIPLPPLPIAHSNGTLPSPVVVSLLSLFPFIHSLLLHNGAPFPLSTSPEEGDRPFHPLRRLLRGVSHSLTQLGIYGFKSDGPAQSTDGSLALHSLLSSINGLPKLRYLLLDVENTFLPHEASTVRFSILSRLHSLSFRSYDRADILHSSLQRYGTRALTRIHLGSPSEELISSLARESSPFLRAIVACEFATSFASPADSLSLIGGHLRYLTSLTVCIRTCITLRRLRQFLASLVNCTTLCTFNLAYLDLETADADPLDAAMQLLPLPSITSLSLCTDDINSSPSLLVEQLPLVRLFPALTSFTFEMIPISCITCGFSGRYIEPSLGKEERLSLRACLLHQLAPLKVLSTLRSITIPNFEDEKIAQYKIPSFETISIKEING